MRPTLRPRRCTPTRADADEVRPEAVVVCGPPALHVDAGLAVVSRGIHLFGRSRARRRQPRRAAADAADTAGVVTLVGFSGGTPRRWRWPGTDRRTRVRHAAAFHWGYLAPGRGLVLGWPSIGASYLSDQAIHAIDAMRSLMGDVSDLEVRRTEGPDGVAGYGLTLGFAGGASGTLALVSGTNAFTTRMAVHGSSGASVVIRDVAAVDVLGRPSLPGGRGVCGQTPGGGPAGRTRTIGRLRRGVSAFARACVRATVRGDRTDCVAPSGSWESYRGSGYLP